MKKLTEIGNKHTTDKGTLYYEAHGYTEIYNDFISDDKSLTLLEIGIWHGDSIRMWNEYNSNIILHAIDIDKNVINYLKNNENVHVHIGNQSDVQFMTSLLNSVGNIDIVIDDGSHNYDDIINSFNMIFPKLKSGSLYFIEDLHAPHAKRELVVNTMSKITQNFELFCNNKLMLIKK